MVDRRAAWTMKVNMVQCRESPWHRKEKITPLSLGYYTIDVVTSKTSASAVPWPEPSQVQIAPKGYAVYEQTITQ